MLKQPLERSGKYVLEFGDLFFEVDPAVGGRITSARLGGTEVLTGPSVNAESYGSTFWTSPQDPDWGWPPIVPIDSGAYTPTATTETFSMSGAVVADSGKPAVDGVSIDKAFAADLERGAMMVTYTIRNQSTSDKQFAPWEITRVAPGGLTFYASDTPPTGDTQPPTTALSGAYFFAYKAATVVKDAKLFSDGKGWLAHLTPGNVLLVKAFADIQPAQAAPAEGEIEIYTSDPANQATAYVEIENQGAYTAIPAGGMLSWSVTWYLRALPGTIMATPNDDLLAFVQQTIQ